MRRAGAALALMLALATASAASAEDLIGRASVIDGDTLEMHGERIRLFGIDAPEKGQLCNDAEGKAYRCGQRAALALADKISSATLECVEQDVDRYGRVVAVCYLANLDLNGWLVSEGLAVDYPRYSGGRYANEQAEAQATRRGLWAGEFTSPWEWRRSNR